MSTLDSEGSPFDKGTQQHVHCKSKSESPKANMSVRHRETSEAVGGAIDTLATIDAAQTADNPLHAARDFTTQDPNHPLERKVVVSLSATLEDLSLKNKPLLWSPTSASTKKILQQSKYTDLAGTQERSGDLKSVVLHKITLDEVKSTFPVPTGLRITGVDENTYSVTGEAFSTIVMPKHSSTTPKVLQEDDVGAAYAFAERFPGYTAQNLSTKGIHDVTSRNFCLVASDHPICAAIKVCLVREMHTFATLSHTSVCLS